MSSQGVEDVIDGFVLGLLLRYFRTGVAILPNPDATVRRENDLDHLRMRWAVSAPVRRLGQRLASHPHELRSVLATRPRVEDGYVRGRLDARATALRRLLTGHPTLVVGHDPVRDFVSGPNQVLLWVLKTARHAAASFASLAPEGSPQRPHALQVVAELEAVSRSAHVREAYGTSLAGRRPGPAAVAEAARSRLPLYVMAAEAYTILSRIEVGDLEALRNVLRDTLLGPTEVWRRFELAVALAASDALGVAVGMVPVLGLLAGGDRLVARVGRYAVFWQSATEAHSAPPPEPSEVALTGILEAYGFHASSDRPDVIVLDGATGKVVAVLEAKYFASGERDGSDALRDAAAQIVRYARGYREPGDLNDLLGASVIALVSLGSRLPLSPQPPGVPWLVDLDALTQRGLADWAARCVAVAELEASASPAAALVLT